jgi:hypothetical protein
MASYDPTLLNIDPYYDDYDEDKKFLRVLFRPGYAVQARELTQLQSILQNQVSRMGDHIFEDGAKIIGGDQSVQNCSYIRVVKGASLDQIGGYDISQIKTDGSTTENVSARVVHYERTPTSTVDNYDLLYVNFLQGNTFQPGGTFGSTFVGGTGAGEIAPVSSDSTDATVVNGVQGRCKVITTSPGIFYTDGFFVKTDKQSTSIYGFTGDGTREFAAPSGSVGFSIRRSVATEGNDATLRDPASGSYNYNAPGADRYKIDLNLGFVTDISTTKNFIELVRFDIGKVIFKTLYTDYAELEKTLARRTYDESGSYTVKPFEIDLREHLNNGSNRGVYSSDRGGDSSKLVSVLQPGKAYLYGYEYETQSPQFLDVNKSRSTSTSSLTKLPGAKLGNYFVGVEVDINGAGPTPVGSGTEWQGNRSFFSTLLVEGDNIIKSSSPVQLWDDAFQLIGTARVHAFKREDDALNLSGMDAEDVWPRPHDGNGILDTKYVYRMYVESFIPGGSSQATLSTATYMTPGLSREPANILNNDFPTLKLIRNISATDTNQTLRDIKNSGLVFEVPQGKTVKSIDQLRYVYSRSQIITTDTNNVATWSLSITTDPDGVHQFFNESGDEIITNNDDYILMARPGDGLPYEIVDYYYQDVSSRPVYTRSSDGKTLTISIPTDGNEENEYLLIAPIVAQDKGAADANITSPTIRSKTFTNNFQEFISTDCRNEGTALDPIWYVEMNKFDVNKVTHMSGGEPSDFLFDDGQRETRYINGKLYIKPEKFSTYVTPDETNPFNGVLNAPIGVTYDYFQHSGAVGPFTVESYAGITYGDIPLFASNSLGKTTSLASCIDFRHSGPVGNELGTHVIPEDNLVSIEESHTFYQARIDKLVARQTFGDDINFDIIEGVPDLSPVAPADRPDSMTLYTIALPPYTHNASDVAVKYIENNRYTMADIGKVEKRVDDLEIYTKLSLIENEIEAMDIEKSTEPGVIGEKVGIVVDTFAGHGLGDVADNKYACSIDYENSTLRPGFAETNHALDTATLVIGDNLQQSSDGLIHSKITDTQSIVSQPLSNGFISVNQFDLINWIGRLEIDPPSDQWFSTTVRPVVKINDIGSNDNWKVNNFNDSRGFGTQWNEWSSIWSGIENIDDKLQNVVGERFLEQARRVNSDIFIASRIEKNVSSVSNIAKTIDQRKSRLNIRLGSVPDTLKKRVNDKIIDVSVVPFIRSSTLTIKAENLKPNSILVPFFDGDDVSQFCTPDGGSLGNTIQTDSFGKITNLKFAIPPKKYLTGEKVFRLTDSSTNTAADAETSAEGVFYAQGVQNTTDTTFSATRPIVLRRQTVTSEKIVRDVYTREDSLNLSLETQWIDPLSQIFTVSPNLYSNGVFLNDINLYFSSKSETLPVTIQIRPTVSGYPSASSIIPFSEVTLYPSEVIIGNDAPSATNFKFTSPVYLQPGNYSLSIVSNTDDYKVYTGNIGLEDSLTGNIITKHPNMGSLFLPQNTNVAEENTSTSIMCEINRCVFTTAPGTLQVDLSEPGVTTNVNLTKIISNELILPSTSVVHKLTFGTSSTTFQVPQNQNYSFSSSQLIPATGGSPEQQTTHTIEFSNPSSSTITPVVDTKNLTLITVENIINNASGGGSYTQENYTDSAVARYLTRSIKLQENGDDVRVMLDLNRPIGTSVEVYCRTLSPTTYKEIAEEPFYQLEQVNEVTETDNPFEFAETSFKLLKSVDSFSTLQVKILMFSGDTSVVPQVKDLRVVALA